MHSSPSPRRMCAHKLRKNKSVEYLKKKIVCFSANKNLLFIKFFDKLHSTETTELFEIKQKHALKTPVFLNLFGSRT